MKAYVLLPAYNEEQNIKKLIEEWLSHKKDLKEIYNLDLIIMPVDDKSTDNTREIIMQMESENVKPIYHKENRGLGGGLLTGFTYFLKNADENDLIFVMDADNTHDPRYCISMIKKLYDENLDCVIASRYCENSEIIGVPKHRNFLSSGAKIYYSLILKIPNVKDYTCGYRVYRYKILKKVFDKYRDEFIKETGFSCMMEIIYKIHLVGGKIGEVGFVLRYDNKLGESKMKILKTIKNSLCTAIKLRNKTKHDYIKIKD